MKSCRKRVSVGAMAVLAVLVWEGGEASADDSSVMLSVRLLRSDAVVFATVGSLRSTADCEGFVDMEMHDVISVRSRWDLRTSPIEIVRVRGVIAADGDTLQVSIGNLGPVRQGGRYMLMLAGGEWEGSGPFPDDGINALEVRADGFVGCGSGYLYGVNHRAFVCGHPDDFASPPVTEAMLRRDLDALMTKAARTRPNMVRELTESVEALSLYPRAPRCQGGKNE